MIHRAGQFGPEVYAAWHDSSLGQITETLERRIIFRLAGPLQGRRVLDVGCGDGSLALLSVKAGAAWVSGCDADLRMVMKARATAERETVDASFSVARAEVLPFADSSFDVVTCVAVLTFVREADMAIREMTRVLRPGGCLVIGDLGRWSLWAARRRVRGWFGAKFWRAARFRSARQLAALMRTAGLSVGPIQGSVFFPPCTMLAHLMAPIDDQLGTITRLGAAFIAIRATKPEHAPK